MSLDIEYDISSGMLQVDFPDGQTWWYGPMSPSLGKSVEADHSLFNTSVRSAYPGTRSMPAFWKRAADAVVSAAEGVAVAGIAGIVAFDPSKRRR